MAKKKCGACIGGRVMIDPYDGGTFVDCTQCAGTGEVVECPCCGQGVPSKRASKLVLKYPATPSEDGGDEPTTWLVVSPDDMEPVRGVAFSHGAAERYKSSGWTVTPLYTRAALAPAAVAVVMPEQRSESEGNSYSVMQAMAWNQCLDAVARLNAHPLPLALLERVCRIAECEGQPEGDELRAFLNKLES